MLSAGTRHRGKMLPVVLIVAAYMIQQSHQSSNTAPPPAMSLAAIDVQVDETEDRRVPLGPSPLVSCTDEDPTRAFIQSMSPSGPCGIKCFSLEPCPGGGNKSDFCLFYQAGQGSLRYASTPQYTMNIACTDDVEKATVMPLTIRVVPNTPPIFIPSTPLYDTKTLDARKLKPGDSLYPISTSDIDGDAIIYTMTTDPNTPYINIGYANGEIRSTTDGRFICTDKVRALVTATDQHNPAIGPYRVDFTFNPANTAPYVSNLDATVNINEKVGVGVTAFDINVVDPLSSARTSLTMRSTSDAGMEQYKLVPKGIGGTVQTRIDPNYERSDTRSVKLYFDVDDGYCKANRTYSLTINIVDVNEPPLLFPNKIQNLEVYEGDVDITTGLQVLDEDINDVHTFSKTGGSKEFNVDPGTGNIYSLSEIDIDKNTEYKTYTQSMKVTDKGGLTSTATVTITVRDKNDQKPYFLSNSYTFAATECTPLGTVIGNVKGDDDDSSFQNNDQIYFGGGAGKIVVMAKGSVVLTQPCLNGETSTGSATIADEGIYPGPLTGTPATITFTCGPCPPPPPPPAPVTPKPATPATPATTPTTPPTPKPASTAKPTTKTKTTKEDDSTSTFLSWLIPAIIGGLVWLALTAFLIYRYCCPCRNPCAGFCKRRPKAIKVKPTEPPKKPKPEKPKKVAPPPPPPPPLPPPPPPPKLIPPPPPPPPPEPKPDPYLFGFWKENFTDQDMMNQPARAAKPAAIETMPSAAEIPRGNAIPPENLKLGNPGPGQHNIPQPKLAPGQGNMATNPAATTNNAAAGKRCSIQ